MENIVERFKAGEVRALARAISILENDGPNHEDILKELFYLTGNAYVIGFTGSPGVGKSSLVDQIVKILRSRGYTIGIIAVDPSSPFTGGALLGDRIRMHEHTLDKGVFIRSMSTRGSLGGLAKTTKDVVKAMDAFGLDWIIIETVGVGQVGSDIMHVADTTIVVLTPGAGDAVQTIKAGIMEIADLFVINKSDLPGVDKLIADVQIMLAQQTKDNNWKPPVVPVSCLNGTGVANLVEEIQKHRKYLTDSGVLNVKRNERTRAETLDITINKWRQKLFSQLKLPEHVGEILDEVVARKKDPYTASSQILEYLGLEEKEINIKPKCL